MHIGFDVAQTCCERTGCAWYADALVRTMARIAPQHHFSLYHHFDRWYNADTASGTNLDVPNVEAPFSRLDPDGARRCWDHIRCGDPLPGRPDIVHSTSFQAPRLPGTRLVFTVFDVSFWVVPEYTTEANRLVCQDGMLAALQNADGFVFISESARREFESIVPGWLEWAGKPFVVTLLGPKGIGATAAAKPANTPNHYWLSVGSLEPRKNHTTLLDAMAIYWERSVRKLPLCLAGGGGWKSEDLRRRLEDFARLGMVHHLGYVRDDELAVLYRDAEALVFPSWYEGFGLPVLEAMAHGCVAISSNRTSLLEIGGDAALYVDAENPEQIALKMLALEQSPELHAAQRERSLAQAARFSWDHTAQVTLDFYRQLLISPGGAVSS